MRELGWSDAGLKTAQIRNTSSAGTVGLDDDIRLLEPSLLDTLDDGVTRRYSGPNDPALAQAKADFRKSLTRNGRSRLADAMGAGREDGDGTGLSRHGGIQRVRGADQT